MTTLWWAGERTTEPPKISLISTEERKIAIGLADAVNPGEAIIEGNMEVEVRKWRNGLLVDPTPLVGNLSYDAVAKVAAQAIDAGLLPRGEACIMIVSFDVSYGLGIERRSSYVVVVAEV